MYFGNYLSLTSWPRMKEVTRLIAEKGEEFAEFSNNGYHRMLLDCLNELTVVLVAVCRTTNVANVVAAYSDWRDCEGGGGRIYGVDNMVGFE